MNPRSLLAAIFLLAVLLAAVGCGVNRASYVAANQAVIDELPVFPEAVELSRVSHAYTSGDGGIFDPADGYGTRVTYRVPPGTTQDDVLEFYQSAATTSGWTSRVESPMVVGGGGGDPIRLLLLCRGDSLVSIDPFNVELTFDLGSTFDLGVDHNSAEPGGPSAC